MNRVKLVLYNQDEIVMTCLAPYQEATSNLLAEGNVDVQYDVSTGVNMGKNLLCLT